MMSGAYGRRQFLLRVCGGLSLLGVQGLPARAQHEDVPWLGEVQLPLVNHETGNAGALQPLLVAEDGTPITTVQQWERRRADIRRQWMEFLGPMPDRPPVTLATLSEDHPEGCRRLLV